MFDLSFEGKDQNDRNDSLKKNNKRTLLFTLFKEQRVDVPFILFQSKKRAHGLKAELQLLGPNQELLCSDEISPGAALRETRPGTWLISSSVSHVTKHDPQSSSAQPLHTLNQKNTSLSFRDTSLRPNLNPTKSSFTFSTSRSANAEASG